MTVDKITFKLGEEFEIPDDIDALTDFLVT